MNKQITIRILIDLLIVVSILNGWWFIALPLGLIGAWFFPYFVEIIVAGIGYDSLFGYGSVSGAWGYAGMIVSILLFAGIATAKRWVR